MDLAWIRPLGLAVLAAWSDALAGESGGPDPDGEP